MTDRIRQVRSQRGLVARRQLNELGIDADRVRNQIRAGRWMARSPLVISTFTGPLGWAERVWLAALHVGGDGIVGGLSALEWHGLQNWHRDDVTVLVDDELSFDPVPGVRFFRTRRPLDLLRSHTHELPVCRVEPAALLHAAYVDGHRAALGLLSATVQQRLTTAERLQAELATMRPLRRARHFRTALTDIAGGAHSMAEIDVARMCREFGLPRPRRQVRRRDAQGRLRYTDCEWQLPDGRLLVLEVDGAFHMDVEHWEDDLARQRGLAGGRRIVVRATAREVRDTPARLVQDLLRLGLQQLCA